MPYVVEPIPKGTTEVDTDIYVVSHGWHTGLIVPAKLIQSRIPELKLRFKDTPYIEFGWGDEGYYPSKEITSGLTIRAVFWSTGSVVHAVAVPEKPSKYFLNSYVEKVCLNGNEYSALVRFIENSFFRNDKDKIIKLKNGLYGDSQFYQGAGDYYLMNTSNKWTAKGLKSGGMDINPTFKLTAGSIMDYVAENSRVLEQGRCLPFAKE